MKKRGLETYLYSTVGVLAMLILIILVNLVAARAKQRIDLTADRAYTLSAGTRAILAKLDTPVQIRFYCTRSENTMPVFLKNYAQRVEDLLEEYRQAAKGRIEIQKLDPQPDSDAEDSARLDGIQPQAVRANERVYLGLSVTLLDQKETIPFLAPARERLLEYDISRAITRVINPKKPVVGIMSALPVGGRMNPRTAQMMGQQNQRPWVLDSELQRDFDLRTVEMSADKIQDEIKVLVVIHPKGISDTAQFAIDQFILRGGKLVAFLDPNCVLDQQTGGPMPTPSSSSLDKLLKAWGLSFDTGQAVADLNYMGRTQQGRAPAVLALSENAMNREDVITTQGNAVMALAGAFTGNPGDGLKETVLIKSSPNAQLTPAATALLTGEEIIKSLQPSGTEYALAVRLTGKFKSAFPNGAPKSPPAKPEESKPDESGEQGLKESAQETSVILFGDVDMIEDQIAVTETGNAFGARLFVPNNGNLALAEGAVEQLGGDSNLIAMRSRANTVRPFTVIREMQAKAETHYQSTIRQLESSLAETQRKLSELQQSKESGQRFILSAEQQQEIVRFRKTEADLKSQLKNERKKLRADIDSLQNRLKWLNIAGMPVLVAVSGVALALVRRQRSAAR